jgi:DNA-binding CsgD family transcriptional regulator/signal transduction histidine kinase
MAVTTEMIDRSRRQHHTGPARGVADQADQHAVTLESLLAILRSSRLDDRAARAAAVEVATNALVVLRTATDHESGPELEPVTGAFTRLRNDLRPLVRFGDLDVQLVDPPASGRALPSEVAHGARAMVRAAVLALVDRGDAHRIRIQWDCDGLNLLMSIRDDGEGRLSRHDDARRPIGERVSALNGTLSVSSTPGWGSSVDIVLPLDPKPGIVPMTDSLALTDRERDVLALVAAGLRNHAIAADLGISDNTVKFHVSNLLRKTATSSRAELAALAASH